MHFTDREIRSNLRDGNVEAYRFIFSEYYKPMVAYARKFVIDFDVARDIVQEVFFYIWEKRENLNIDLSVKSYLFRATRNASLNHLKRDEYKNNYAASLLAKLNATSEVPSNYENGYQFLLEKELSAEIGKIVNSLPVQCRTIFELSRYKGLKNKEIAESQGVSVRTVETQIYRALKVLRSNLSHHLSILLIGINW